jgi:hypothetical protein
MICDNNGDDYCGLDSDLDTEAEVETAIRFFPDVLSCRKGDRWDYNKAQLVDAEGEGEYPIRCISYLAGLSRPFFNLRSVSFIPLYIRLAIEFGVFAKELSGGLLCGENHGDNVLQRLVASSSIRSSEDHNRLVVSTIAASFIS